MRQFKIDENWKQNNGKYKCPYCDNEYSKKGISTHIWRTHGDGKNHISGHAEHLNKTGKNAWHKGKTLVNLSEAFSYGSKHRTGQLKKWIIDNKLKEYKCSECNIIDEYNGKSIVLELDHIDGDNRNNELENLRFLCPNCHSQTTTFRGRGRKGKKYKVTDQQLMTAIENNKNIYNALLELNLSPSGGNHLRAKKLINNAGVA